jgi:Na+-transporting methylmalonyl-CoA/oxaloacetate decarboxylase gamma subunit
MAVAMVVVVMAILIVACIVVGAVVVAAVVGQVYGNCNIPRGTSEMP